MKIFEHEEKKYVDAKLFKRHVDANIKLVESLLIDTQYYLNEDEEAVDILYGYVDAMKRMRRRATR
jgi:hypothetical protein